jgi:hypothetical protein
MPLLLLRPLRPNGAHDYPPYYKRFLTRQSAHFNWLPSHIFSPTDIAALQLLERPKDFYRYVDAIVPRFGLLVRKRGRPEKPTIFTKARDRLLKLAVVALRLRAAFRRIVHAWIWRKAAAAPLPDSDIITMSPFKVPIIYTDMHQRRRYKFEAGPLAAHIKGQLEYVSYRFVEPLWPRNPMTNTHFSSAQLYVIYKACLTAGIMNATFAAFRECNFLLSRFIAHYSVPIAFNYNLTNVRDVHSETGHEILIDYIIELSDIVCTTYDEEQRCDLEYGLLHYGDCAFFKGWRELFCKQQNVLEIDSHMLVTASYLCEGRFALLNKFRVERRKNDDCSE